MIESSASSSSIDSSLQDHDGICPESLACSLLGSDFTILFNVDVFIGLKDADFVIWEFDTMASTSVIGD